MTSSVFDAIVVGSGISGGWAAKELTERGARVLLIDRGRMVRHGEDYPSEHKAPWEMPFHGFGDRLLYESDYAVQRRGRGFEEGSAHFFVNDREHPYKVEPGTRFSWLRGYQVGGRSLVWGRASFRLSDFNFGENKRDGHGIDWPIRYADISPWYDHVERFIGVSGAREGIDSLPDGEFLPPFAMNCIEEHAKKGIERSFPGRRMINERTAVLSQDHNGRSACHLCGPCQRGCSTGSYFSTQSSTLPAAEATERLTVMSDTIVAGVDYDPTLKRVTGVRTINSKTGARETITARLIFLNASTLGTIHILLNSRSNAFPNGLANSSGAVGRDIMDTVKGPIITGTFSGFEDQQPIGNRPTGIYIPRFRNVADRETDFLRGYGYQGSGSRALWTRGIDSRTIGADLKAELRKPGPWTIMLGAMGEPLPNYDNVVRLDPNKTDKWGLPQLLVSHRWTANEERMAQDMADQGEAMMRAAGAVKVTTIREIKPAGETNHEMGGARMGHDPREAVLNRFNQAHDIANLFITDGSCMTSSPCQNPSLTYMALSARAADFAMKQLKEGAL
ncbi:MULTISPECIES: GMC oxidoreductase [unclassified Sphingomonas]|uniref:GMC oxidoreductase n=1 Tax=unclassified Sphingomonas TaxID=196159 RepID=UPI0006F287C7|nr:MULTISPECIES: GMC family oxidoreductase [unclassified Sphingomonas]KQX22592.1 GMC family oxidoreductase [Sphingomonas sp. Root1294]KQY67930.1 GMC family oxidoreductase [Sphingomonas sp. Root50]KRB88854.1 GMC family oxidoreductase [Sphingomonas sp. Root720]